VDEGELDHAARVRPDDGGVRPRRERLAPCPATVDGVLRPLLASSQETSAPDSASGQAPHGDPGATVEAFGSPFTLETLLGADTHAFEGYYVEIRDERDQPVLIMYSAARAGVGGGWIRPDLADGRGPPETPSTPEPPVS
jgi:hypothetical protein